MLYLLPAISMKKNMTKHWHCSTRPTGLAWVYEERDDMTYLLATCYLKTGECKRSCHLVWKPWKPAVRNTTMTALTISLIYAANKSAMTKHWKVSSLCRTTPNIKHWCPITLQKFMQSEKTMIKLRSKHKTTYRHIPEWTCCRNVPHPGRCFLSFPQIPRSNQRIWELSWKCFAPPDALYMLGLSYFQTGVYSKAAETLGEVTGRQRRIDAKCVLAYGTFLPATGRKEQSPYGFLNRLPPPMPIWK